LPAERGKVNEASRFAHSLSIGGKPAWRPETQSAPSGIGIEWGPNVARATLSRSLHGRRARACRRVSSALAN